MFGSFILKEKKVDEYLVMLSTQELRDSILETIKDRAGKVEICSHDGGERGDGGLQDAGNGGHYGGLGPVGGSLNTFTSSKLWDLDRDT